MRDLTILVPALDEEAHIAQTVEELVQAAHEELDAFEIVLVDDGSRDATPRIMDDLAVRHENVRVIHNPEPRGLGWAYKRALAEARHSHFTLLPGDNAYAYESLQRLLRAVGAADLLISYRTNQFRCRKLSRVLLSLTYKRIVNSLFRLGLLDYHSAVVFPTEAVRKLDLDGRGYAFQLEALVKLLRSGVSFVQVPVALNAREESSRSLRLRTLRDVARTLRDLARGASR